MSKAAKDQGLTVVEDRDHTPAPAASPLVNVLNVLVSRPDLDIDRIEKMIDLQMKVEADQARKSYFAALAELQADLPVVAAQGVITGEDKSGNKIRRSQYAKWEDIVETVRPALVQHGFALRFEITDTDPTRIRVTCFLSHRDGHAESTSMALGIDSSGGKNNPQGWGSAVSYCKRYTAMLMLNIASRGEDDDGDAAGGEFISDAQQERLKQLLAEINGEHAHLLKVAKAESYDKIRVKDYGALERRLLQKAKEAGK